VAGTHLTTIQPRHVARDGSSGPVDSRPLAHTVCEPNADIHAVSRSESHSNTDAVRQLSSESHSNTDAVRQLSSESESNSFAIGQLTARRGHRDYAVDCWGPMAGRPGFEPGERIKSPLKRLAGARIRPLCHLPAEALASLPSFRRSFRGRKTRRGLTLQPGRKALQISNECGHLDLARLIVWRPQDRRWVDRGHHERQARPLDELTALRPDSKIAAEHRLRRGRPEQHQNGGLDERDLRVEPRPAGTDLRGIRLLMEPSLSRPLPFECLTALVM
jgi:hypothetical protein